MLCCCEGVEIPEKVGGVLQSINMHAGEGVSVDMSSRMLNVGGEPSLPRGVFVGTS